MPGVEFHVAELDGVLFHVGVEYHDQGSPTVHSIRVTDATYAPTGPNLFPLFDKLAMPTKLNRAGFVTEMNHVVSILLKEIQNGRTEKTVSKSSKPGG